jgi:hypothetical protein
MAGLPQEDFILFQGQDDEEYVSDFEENSNLAAMEPLVHNENSHTPQLQTIDELFLRINEFLVRIDELLVCIQDLLARIDERIRTLRNIDSGYSSWTNSP